MFFALSLPDHPQSQYLTEHTNVFIALGPVVTMNYAQDEMLLTLADYSEYGSDYLEWENYLEAYGPEYTEYILSGAGEDEEDDVLVDAMCYLMSDWCGNIDSAVTATDLDLVNTDGYDYYVGNGKSGTSLKNLVHMS